MALPHQNHLGDVVSRRPAKRLPASATSLGTTPGQTAPNGPRDGR